MLIALLATSLSLQAQPAARSDTAKRPPVSTTLMASAFADPAARDLLNRARRTRLVQDSSLKSYDAKVRQRLSVRASIGRFGPEKLVYRHESAARVQWQRGTGANIDMTGVRVAIPIAGTPSAEREAVQEIADDLELSPVPYYPGSENIWIGGGTAKSDVDERKLIHPLANGAEEFYTYATGDSASFKLPNGQSVRIRELKLRPRTARANAVVGSLWFDVSTGSLVRATYRLAAAGRAGVSVSDSGGNKPPRLAQFIVKALVGPGTADISAIVVEYGLYQGRFWLPRTQSMEGYVEIMFARVPVTYENAFEYESVNTDVSFAAFTVDTMSRGRLPRLNRPPAGLDSAALRHWRDSVSVLLTALRKAREDSVKAGLHVGSMHQCDVGSTRVITEYRYDKSLPVQIHVPCNTDSLTHSADLPKSIYDAGDAIFGAGERAQAIADALSMGAQAPFGFALLPPVQSEYGLSMSRYNRVEGFSTGLRLAQELGGGYQVGALGRFGFSDRIPNGELFVERANGSATIRLNGYTRLAAANDWANPLSFGSSLSALLFGRDDGFYYRAAGAELLFRTQRGMRLDWRVFADHERSAIQTRSGFTPNIVARQGNYQGAAVRHLGTFGTDPFALRAFTDLRLEGAHGDSSYGRGSLEVTVADNITQRIAAAITLSGGSSVGSLPAQQLWYLGGAHTIRGQSPDTAQSGNAYWFSRLELARQHEGYKISLFGDLGWTGDRNAWQQVGRPLSGAGVGMSMLDGFLRFDVARGIYPRQQTRVNLYLDGRF